MRIDVVGRNLDVTEAIRQHAVTKAEKLPRYYDGVQQVTMTLSHEDHKGNFGVELVIDVEKHDDFVSRASGEDLYAVIDEVVHKGVRQLTDFKERLKLGKR